MSASATQVDVLSTETLDFLRQHQIDGSVSSGMRRMRRGILRDSSDDTTWHQEVEIPVTINSLEALRFIGPKKATAQIVLERFNNQFVTHGHPAYGFETDVYNLIDFATGHLEGHVDAVSPNDDWLGALKELGIRKSAREAICNSAFDNIRFTKTAKEWAQETLRDGFGFIVGADKKIKNARRRIEKDLSDNLKSLSVSEVTQSVSAAGSSSVDKKSSIPILTTKDLDPEVPDDRVMIYKGGVSERLRKVLRSDGTLNMRELVSTPSGDFAREKLVWYFTKQKDMAWQYANYANARSPAVECGILAFACPRELLNDGYEIRGDEWLDLVWSSRGPTYDDAEAEVQARYDEYEVLFGQCCNQSDAGIARLAGGHERTILKTAKMEKGVQWVIMTNGRIRKIGEACAGFVWFKVTHS